MQGLVSLESQEAYDIYCFAWIDSAAGARENITRVYCDHIPLCKYYDSKCDEECDYCQDETRTTIDL